MLKKKNITSDDDLLKGLFVGVVLVLCVWLCVLVYQTKQSTNEIIQDFIKINATLDNITETFSELQESTDSLIEKTDGLKLKYEKQK